MFKKINLLFFIILFSLISLPVNAEQNHECRFWAMIKTNNSANISPAITQQLLSTKNKTSIHSLGKQMNDGWSVTSYEKDDQEYQTTRSPHSTFSNLPNKDNSNKCQSSFLNYNDYRECNFKDFVNFHLAPTNPFISTAHVRLTSSGVTPPTGNPHNFEKETSNGEEWIFGHNGTISKDILLELITSENLELEYGSLKTISKVIDSELFFIYILEQIEKNNYNIKKALQIVVKNLWNKGYASGNINFYLTNGEKIWAFSSAYNKPSSTYNLVYKITDNYIAISSESLNDETWKKFPSFSLGIISQKKGLKIINIDPKNKEIIFEDQKSKLLTFLPFSLPFILIIAILLSIIKNKRRKNN
jgi:predicted glutamine amidotransferase